MPNLRLGALLLAALFCTLAGASAQDRPASGDGSARLDAALRQASAGRDRHSVIVTVRPGSRERLKGLLAARGRRVTLDHADLDAVSADIDAVDARALAQDPDVLSVSTDAVVTVDTPVAAESMAALAAASRRDVQLLRSTLGVTARDSARSVGVAVIDSGIASSPDFANRIVAFYDFTRGGIRTRPTDPFGHGTHIAGLIAGNGAQSGGKYVGVSDARLIGLRVLNARGEGRTSHVIAAIEFAVRNRRRLGIDVINLSLGHPIFESAATDPLVRAVERAVASGIVVVTAAGNHGASRDGRNGYAGITSPGNAPSAITVGSLDTRQTAQRSDDVVSRFSSRGPTWHDGYLKPDVLAPGQSLTAISTKASAIYRDGRFAADIAPYVRMSGTSMATAVTTGVVALAIEANRRDERWGATLTPNTVKAILQYTAVAVPDEDPATAAAFEQGAGAINAAGAITMARAINPSARVGNWWLEKAVVPASTIAGQQLAWSQHIVWGTHIVWGNALMVQQKAWSQGTVWGRRGSWSGNAHAGDNLVQESLPVWTSSIVWGSGLVTALDDEHIVWGTLLDEHIVWGSGFDEHIVWGTGDLDDHIVWGSGLDEHIVWGSGLDEHIVWGSGLDEHIVWGSKVDEHIVWGTKVDEHIVWGTVIGRAASGLD
jgi:serine protease AprX